MPRPIDIKPDHIQGGFEWAKGPACCSQLKHAFEDKFLFVASMVDGEGGDEHNLVYMMPVDSDDNWVRPSGVGISNCPWCGAKLRVRKKS